MKTLLAELQQEYERVIEKTKTFESSDSNDFIYWGGVADGIKYVINEYKFSDDESTIIMQEQAKEIVRLTESLKQIKSVAEFRLGLSDTANDVYKIATNAILINHENHEK